MYVLKRFTRERRAFRRQNEEGAQYYLFGYRAVGRINRLSAITRVPKAAYIREGIDIVLKKYEKGLKGRTPPCWIKQLKTTHLHTS